MLVAATETTASTLEWVMSELVQHPRVMRATQLEIREALRGKKSIDDDVAELHQLKLVIKETLRLHPPLPLLLPRTCGDDVELLGFRVPRGSRGHGQRVGHRQRPRALERSLQLLAGEIRGKRGGFQRRELGILPFWCWEKDMSGDDICPGRNGALPRCSSLPLQLGNPRGKGARHGGGVRWIIEEEERPLLDGHSLLAIGETERSAVILGLSKLDFL
ncbi:hypothetical protein HPP92_024682 [Vanilla planifolia]|uniref:Cytochrome P450 n=1 Tax=Vanilla planifolia TaxID=51239 RepID=A0A835PK46_VANPL|nr:hypothetical protein HPP92_024682 [Vanilla planifolia]